MTSDAASLGLSDRFARWRNNLIASPRFQSWASRFPLTRRFARRDGARLMELVAGFVHSQVLMAVLELDVLEALRDRPQGVDALALRTGLSPDRLTVLLQASSALDLTARRRDGRFALGRLGAALIGVPGLREMVLHHRVLYRDLADPLAVFQGKPTALAEFWPYVFGASDGDVDPGDAALYSDLMAKSQGLVAEETLRSVDLSDVDHLLDVGGGTGAFLRAVGAAHSDIALTLFDLPSVVAGAAAAKQQLGDRFSVVAGSFRDDPLPQGADAISLIRILFDHRDETILALLQKVHDALPPGGRLIISEPMSGGAKPDRAGDAYYAIYTLAMGTGRVRSQARIAEILQSIGFVDVSTPKSARPYVTSIVTARRKT